MVGEPSACVLSTTCLLSPLSSFYLLLYVQFPVFLLASQALPPILLGHFCATGLRSRELWGQLVVRTTSVGNAHAVVFLPLILISEVMCGELDPGES